MTHDQLKCALILLGWKETKFSSDPAVWKFKDSLYGLRVYNATRKDVSTGKSFEASFYSNYDTDYKHAAIFETYKEALSYIMEII